MRIRFAASAVLVAVILLGGWAFYLEPRSLVVRRCDLELPGWPPSQDGLTVALVSDLHVGSPYFDLDKLREVVRRIGDARPDLVLLAGDYVIDDVWGGRFTPPEATASVLATLDAPLGVYAVLGNHDWWLDGARVRRSLEFAGIVVLDNRLRRVRSGRFSFQLLGLGDFWEDPPDVAALAGELDASGGPVIAFTHNPDVFPRLPSSIAVTLAGHTHGGQVRLPLLGRPIVPSRYGGRFAAGHVVEDGRHLFVTTGLGTSLLPVRFRVPPEIAMLRLFAAETGATDD